MRTLNDLLSLSACTTSSSRGCASLSRTAVFQENWIFSFSSSLSSLTMIFLYKKIIVKEDRLELKEKIQFSWNTAVLDKDAHPLLDEVVQALKDNKSFNVRIQGHASIDGPYEHNQTLSNH